MTESGGRRYTAPELVHRVADLSGRAGLPMPRVYIIDNPQPNAFELVAIPNTGSRS